MKKYNKPEIEALALETLDVIALSAESRTTIEVLGKEISHTTVAGEVTITDFTGEWSW